MSKQICIGMATYKRPKMLFEAISSLEKLTIPSGFEAYFILCDNDAEETAKPVFDDLTEKIPFGSTYLLQKERGIVPARNAILKEALEQRSKYLAFFDDDETVDEGWLSNLVLTAEKYDAKAVSGRVIYSLPENAPKWLKKRNFYGGDRPPTGTQVRGASTNNVLVDLDFLQANQLSFNMKFSMSGGSDSFLFREVRDKGGSIVSCREAVAYEEVPESRATEEWILNRAYKNGFTEITRRLVRNGKTYSYTIGIGYGLWLSMSFLFAHLLYPFTNYSYHVFNKRRPRKIKGMIAAFRGIAHEEYRSVHGN